MRCKNIKTECPKVKDDDSDDDHGDDDSDNDHGDDDDDEDGNHDDNYI